MGYCPVGFVVDSTNVIQRLQVTKRMEGGSGMAMNEIRGLMAKVKYSYS